MLVKFIDIHTHNVNSNNEVISIYNFLFDKNSKFSEFNSIGIHPWKISKNWEQDFEIIRKISEQKNIKFIGETGLDKLKGTDLLLQELIFENHISLANQLKKPLIIHCVKSQNEIIAILKKNNFNQKVIFHGFDKKLSSAKEIIKNGYFISLGKSLFTKPELAKEILQMIPHQNIFFETDNSHYAIQDIYQQASQLSGHTIDYWKKTVFSNFEKLEL